MFCTMVRTKLIGVRSVDIAFGYCVEQSGFMIIITGKLFQQPTELQRFISKIVVIEFSLLIHVVLKGTFHAVAMETNPPLDT